MEKVKLTYSTTVFAILFALAMLVLYFARYVFVSSLIGIGIGVLVLPVLQFLREKFHLPKSVSAILVFLGITMLTILVLGSLYYIVNDQVKSLSQTAPYIFEQINTWILKIFNQYPWIKDQVEHFDATATFKRSMFTVFKGFQTGFLALSGAVFALVIGIYTAVDGRHLFESSIEAFRPKHRQRARDVMQDCARVLRGWFQAQLIDMAIIGALTALGLWIAKVDYWAVFGLLTAVLGIIPYLGIILVVITASLITLATDPSQVPWVVLVFIITQQLEGNLILPLVMKGRAELPVVPLLIFMLFMGTFFGVLGFFFAPPLFAVLRTLYIDLYLPSIETA